MDLNEVSVFARVVQAGSFTAASHLLGMPKSTVSAKVAALEKRLGVSLIHRTTRKLSVTEAGETFFRASAKALGELEAAEADAASGQKTPQGLLRVTAPIDAGPRFLSNFLPGFLARHPAVSVDIILTNRMVDIIGEGIDVAIRAGALKDSSLMAKRVGGTTFGLFASPDYLARRGTPSTPDELSDHDCLRFSRERDAPWKLTKGRATRQVRVSGRVIADDLSTLRQLAINNLGIALLPTFSCADDAYTGRLVSVLPGWRARNDVISLVYPAQRYQHPKVRVFVSEMAEMLQKEFATVDKICRERK